MQFLKLKIPIIVENRYVCSACDKLDTLDAVFISGPSHTPIAEEISANPETLIMTTETLRYRIRWWPRDRESLNLQRLPGF